jgi:hypothetical protein
MYKQYANVLLPNGTYTFAMSASTNANSIVVFDFKRARYKEKLDPGNWQLDLYSASATMSFIDNFTSTATGLATTAGSRVSIVSGSVGTIVDSTNI